MTLRRADRVFWRQTEGFLVLCDGEGALTEVSGNGGEVWDCLTEPIAESAVASMLAARHGIGIEVVERDITPLIAGLVERGLVVRDD